MINKRWLILVLLLLVGCGGQHKEVRGICSSAGLYGGERRDNSLDLSGIARQPVIDFSQVLDAASVKELDETMEWIIANTGVTDVTVTLAVPGKGVWSNTHLVTQPQAANVNPDDAVFWWASVGKAFTAAVIQQLVNEKKLDLDDTIDTWFPNVKNAKLITVNQLLTHTSGLYSFQEDAQFRAQGGYQAPQALLDIALTHEPLFCPGTAWYYSNTGYLLLGLLIEKIENKSYSQVIRDRITQPLKMQQTWALTANEFPENLILTGDAENDNIVMVPSLPFSAGNIVGSSRDMIIFLQALLTGSLYGVESTQASVAQLFPMFDAGLFYGKGIMSYQMDTPEAHINWIGHSGGTQTKNALIAYDLDTGAYIAVAVNDKTSAAAIAVRFFSAVKALDLANR